MEFPCKDAFQLLQGAQTDRRVSLLCLVSSVDFLTVYRQRFLGELMKQYIGYLLFGDFV